MPFHLSDVFGDIAIPDLGETLLVQIVSVYFKSLEAQADAEGRWKSIPDPLVRWLQPHYGVDLGGVRYAEGIDTRNEVAVTVERSIYFPKAIDLETAGHVHWLMHELRHCDQYEEMGGKGPFLKHYASQIFQNVIDSGTFNVHDLLDVEEEAENKAVGLNDQMAGLLAARRVALKSHGGPFLSAHGEGSRLTATGGTALVGETYWLVDSSAGTVAIAAFDGRFVTLDALGGAVTEEITVGGAERWSVTPLGGDRVAFRAANGHFLRAVGGDVTAGGSVVGDPETFRVIDV